MKLVVAFLLTLMSLNAKANEVSGYYRSNGTYVSPYQRTQPDSNPYNNYNPPTQRNTIFGGSSGPNQNYSPRTNIFGNNPDGN